MNPMRNDGGAAFPQTRKALMVPSDMIGKMDLKKMQEIEIEHRGMTLLDYFAAKAMASLVGGHNWTEEMEHIAKRSYQMAQAMLTQKQLLGGNGK